MDRKKTIIILAIIWAGLIIYNIGAFMKDEAETTPAVKRSRRSFSDETAAMLELPFDDKVKKSYPGVKKDIFSPLKPPVVMPVEAQQAAQQVDKPPPMPSPIEIFINNVRFMGSLEKEEKKTVFLSRNEDVFLVKKGDIIDNRFKVEEIAGGYLRIKDNVSGEELSLEFPR